MSSNPCNYIDYGCGDHSTADLSYVWLFGHRSKLWALVWPTASRLYARSVCDTTTPLQLLLMFVALYKCYVFTFYL